MGVLGLQDETADLLKKLSDGSEEEQKASAAALVGKGTGARSAVQRALEKAGSDRRARFEDVLVRIDSGTDEESLSFDEFAFRVESFEAVQEPTETIKVGLRLKVVFEGKNGGSREATVTLARATLVTAKGKMDLLVKGSKGEAFSRTFDPAMPKLFAYGAVVPPRYPPGARAAAVFEIECAGKRKLLRTPLATIAKKGE